MAGQAKDRSALESEIAHLRDLDLAELKRRWLTLYACPVPKFFRREHLIRAIGHRMQSEAFGDLKPSTRRLLRTIVDAVRTGKENGIVPVPRMRPGTKLIRVWQGKTHIVSTLDDGFEWQGSRYRSLSEVARAITGTRWNGLVFFGVKPRPSGHKNASEGEASRNA
jgi:Protein of unknown function (DUF2924)